MPNGGAASPESSGPVDAYSASRFSVTIDAIFSNRASVPPDSHRVKKLLSITSNTAPMQGIHSRPVLRLSAGMILFPFQKVGKQPDCVASVGDRVLFLSSHLSVGTSIDHKDWIISKANLSQLFKPD